MTYTESDIGIERHRHPATAHRDDSSTSQRVRLGRSPALMCLAAGAAVIYISGVILSGVLLPHVEGQFPAFLDVEHLAAHPWLCGLFVTALFGAIVSIIVLAVTRTRRDSAAMSRWLLPAFASGWALLVAGIALLP